MISLKDYCMGNTKEAFQINRNLEELSEKIQGIQGIYQELQQASNVQSLLQDLYYALYKDPKEAFKTLKEKVDPAMKTLKSNARINVVAKFVKNYFKKFRKEFVEKARAVTDYMIESLEAAAYGIQKKIGELTRNLQETYQKIENLRGYTFE